MTTLIPFTPSNANAPPFQTLLTLDGATAALACTWNIGAQRWYATISDTSGNLIWSGALVGSPPDSDILLAPGIFTTSTILFREDEGNFEVTP